jgi:hypothetical protein
MSGESGSRASARRMSLIAPAVGKPGPSNWAALP